MSNVCVCFDVSRMGPLLNTDISHRNVSAALMSKMLFSGMDVFWQVKYHHHHHHHHHHKYWGINETTVVQHIGC
jgi:hypothetical protein